MPQKGYRLSDEHRKNISLSRKGAAYLLDERNPAKSPEARRKISESKMGDKNPAKRDDVRAKISAALKGNKLCLGRVLSQATKDKISIGNLKRKGGITPVVDIVRTSETYSKWRQSVFIRDDFTCQDCGVRGGYLEAHHKKQFSVLVQEAISALPLFDRVYACYQYSPLWDLYNGITLCKKCHYKTRKGAVKNGISQCQNKT